MVLAVPGVHGAQMLGGHLASGPNHAPQNTFFLLCKCVFMNRGMFLRLKLYQTNEDLYFNRVNVVFKTHWSVTENNFTFKKNKEPYPGVLAL